MRYRLAVLGIATVLFVLPVQPTAPSAPAPKNPKALQVYALVYVGIGRSHPFNATRIRTALQKLPACAHGAFFDEKARSLPIVQDREKKLGWKERNDWAASKIRVTSLEGTAVLRVEFTEGSPREQAILVNAFAHDFVKDEKKFNQDILRDWDSMRGKFKGIARANKQKEEDVDRHFDEQKEIMEHSPVVLQEATVPEQR